MSWNRWNGKDKIVKNAIEICIFIIIASFPFITVTQTIGMDTFLDSFENPDYYIFLQDKNNLFGSIAKDEEYLIIQKSTHPNFNVEKSDSIIYFNNNGFIACNKIYKINSIGSIKRYHTIEENNIAGQLIYEGQILGKLMKVLDNNIWNLISIKIWDTSIHTLNLRALLTSD